MYDMYHWNEPGAAATDAPARPPAKDEERSGAASSFAAALQMALDRRDNGGDAGRRPQQQR